MKACFEHQFQNAVGWRLKVEIKRIYEIADLALAPPHFFAKQLTPSQPRGLGHQIWCFENESTLKKCCWLHSFLAMKAKSKNQKYIWTCWLCFSPAPIFCQTFYPISTNVAWTPISKCCWLETKSRNQKDIWNCWPCFSPTPIFLPNSYCLDGQKGAFF